MIWQTCTELHHACGAKPAFPVSAVFQNLEPGTAAAGAEGMGDLDEDRDDDDRIGGGSNRRRSISSSGIRAQRSLIPDPDHCCGFFANGPTSG
jgi:hypothetical protein